MVWLGHFGCFFLLLWLLGLLRLRWRMRLRLHIFQALRQDSRELFIILLVVVLSRVFFVFIVRQRIEIISIAFGLRRVERLTRTHTLKQFTRLLDATLQSNIQRRLRAHKHLAR